MIKLKKRFTTLIIYIFLINNSFASVSDAIFASVGGKAITQYDIVKETLVDFGFKILFDSVAMRPGKPTTFGKIGNNKFFLGVPGNPVSCFIASIMFLPLIINSFYGVKLNNLVRSFLISNSKKIINS